ncbi:serine/threonine-protein kinase KIN2, partial [Kappamyces sp. JEL0680]
MTDGVQQSVPPAVSATSPEAGENGVNSNSIPTSVQLPSGRKWIGKWKLGRTIGEGSSGKVKLAQHVETRETLANGMTANNEDAQYAAPESLSKVYKRELYMIREACLGMMLHHPNIVRLHSAILGENHFYCFFELVEGEDLVDFISREGALGEARSRDIFRKVLSAIEYAHRNHVVHRDIKLENIRYNSVTGVVKILDFGFASFYTSDKTLATNCGSPCYASPEIYDNRPYDGPMVDVWSLG